MLTNEQFRRDLLERLIVEAIAENVLEARWEWRDEDMARQQFQSARVTYQSVSDKSIRTSDLVLNHTQKSIRFYDVMMNERFRICIQVEKTSPLLEDRYCVEDVANYWNLTASIGSTVGAFLALGIIIFVVWLSQRACCKEKRKRIGKNSQRGLDSSMQANYCSSSANSRLGYSNQQEATAASARERYDTFPLEYYEDGDGSDEEDSSDEDGLPYSSTRRTSLRKATEGTSNEFHYEAGDDPREHFHDDIDLLTSHEHIPIQLDGLQEMQRCTCGYIHVIQTDDFLLFEGQDDPSVFQDELEGECETNLSDTQETQSPQEVEKV